MMWQFQSLCERECGRKSCEDIIAVSFDEHQRYRQRFLQFQLSTIASGIRFGDRALNQKRHSVKSDNSRNSGADAAASAVPSSSSPGSEKLHSKAARALLTCLQLSMAPFLLGQAKEATSTHSRNSR